MPRQAAKPNTRVSGVHKADSTKGKQALKAMRYGTTSKGYVHPDYELINTIIKGYLDKPENLHNIYGLTIDLDIGITTLHLYSNGYVSQEDVDSETVIPNKQLSSVIARGTAGIIAKAFNNQDKVMQQKIIRQLEGMGALAPKKKIIEGNVNFTLGRIKTFGK